MSFDDRAELLEFLCVCDGKAQLPLTGQLLDLQPHQTPTTTCVIVGAGQTAGVRHLGVAADSWKQLPLPTRQAAPDSSPAIVSFVSCNRVQHPSDLVAVASEDGILVHQVTWPNKLMQSSPTAEFHTTAGQAWKSISWNAGLYGIMAAAAKVRAAYFHLDLCQLEAGLVVVTSFIHYGTLGSP